jgi:hypothetical protein
MVSDADWCGFSACGVDIEKRPLSTFFELGKKARKDYLDMRFFPRV